MVYILSLVLTVPWVGLKCVIVAFSGLVTSTVIQGSVFTSSDRYCESDSNGSYWKSGQ